MLSILLLTFSMHITNIICKVWNKICTICKEICIISNMQSWDLPLSCLQIHCRICNRMCKVWDKICTRICIICKITWIFNSQIALYNRRASQIQPTCSHHSHYSHRLQLQIQGTIVFTKHFYRFSKV